MAIRTVSEYARAHGVTERTVRRHIRQGQIPARLVDGPYGPEYHILDSDDPGADTVADSPTDTLADDPGPSPASGRHPSWSGPPLSPDALIHALALADRLSRENVELAGRCGFYQSEIQHLQAYVRALEGELKLLRMPAEMPVGEMANHLCAEQNGQDSAAQMVSEMPEEQPEAGGRPEASAPSAINGQEGSSGGVFKRFWYWLTQPG